MDKRDKALIELLEKWRNGHFTQSDEQELKALAREGDAFVKAAIDGMLSTPDHAHEMAFRRLQGRMSARTHLKSKWGKNWYATAAALALLCVAVWWIWPRQQPAISADSMANVTPSTDSNASVSPALPERQAQATTKRLPGSSVAASEQGEAFQDTAIAYANDDGIHAIEAPVVKEEEKLVSMPTMTSAPDPGRILRNAAPPEDYKTGDTPGESTASVGYGKVKDEAKEAPHQSDAKVVPKAAVKKSDKKAKIQSTPAPVVGWDRFRADMKALKLPDDAKAQGLTRLTAVLQLDINLDSGTIQKVTVLQKAGFGCDAQAEIFVRNYLWVVPSGNSGSVVTEVEFN